MLKFTRQDVLLITFVSKRPTALDTAETLWVPVLVQSRHHFLRGGRRSWVASGALSYYSGFSYQRRLVTQTVAASHVQNGLVAVGTVGGEEGEVVRLAVRPSVLFKEVAIPQFGLTFGADKVLGVPHLSESRHHLRQEIKSTFPPARLARLFTSCWGGGFGRLTCPSTGFWQAEQFPLEDVWTPWRLRSDWSSPSMLSREPPDDDFAGAGGCCGAVTTAVAGTAGWGGTGHA